MAYHNQVNEQAAATLFRTLGIPQLDNSLSLPITNTSPASTTFLPIIDHHPGQLDVNGPIDDGEYHECFLKLTLKRINYSLLGRANCCDVLGIN